MYMYMVNKKNSKIVFPTTMYEAYEIKGVFGS